MSATDLITREIANAVEESRAAVHEAVLGYFESRRDVEAAALTDTAVRVLNGSSVVVEGASVNTEMAAHLRGAGYHVLHVGNMLTARRATPKRTSASRRSAMQSRAGRPGAASKGLRFFNDTKSMNWARRAYQELVGAPDWRYFPRFLESLDNVIADSRAMNGLDEDDGVDEGLTADEPAPMTGDRRGVVATVEFSTDPAAPEALSRALVAAKAKPTDAATVQALLEAVGRNLVPVDVAPVKGDSAAA